MHDHDLVELPSSLFMIQNLRTLDVSRNRLGPTSLNTRQLATLTNLKSLNLDYNQLLPLSKENVTWPLGKASNKNKATSNELFLQKLVKLQTLSLAYNNSNTNTNNGPTHDVATKQHPAGALVQKFTSVTLSSPPSRKANVSHQSKHSNNDAATAAAAADNCLPSLPSSLKHLNMAGNALSRVPRAIYANYGSSVATLSNLEHVDLSFNQLTFLPDVMFQSLPRLEELLLDDNQLEFIPTSIGTFCSKLKRLSLRNNCLKVIKNGTSSDPPPLPRTLFTDTQLIDLNLHGNSHLSNTQFNALDGCSEFLERRQKVKNKTMSNLEGCGLE